MPRGIYDRSKFKKNADKPQAKSADKRTPAKKALRTVRRINAKSAELSGTSWPSMPAPAPAVVPAAPPTKPFFIIGDVGGLHIFESVDDCVKHMVNRGASAEDVGGAIHTQILEVHMHAKPEPKNVRLTYTL